MSAEVERSERSGRSERSMRSEPSDRSGRSDIGRLQGRLRTFAAERDWEQYHTPKSMAMALAGEAGELLAEFQWLTPEESAAVMYDPDKTAAWRWTRRRDRARRTQGTDLSR